jgi:cysteine sulfinate desulfinase/cysteine desulfurase-like protein
MGLSEDEAYASVRFSVSASTTLDDVEWAAQQLHEICQQLQTFLHPVRWPHPHQQGRD